MSWTLLASEPECPGDGNIDLVVDQKDLDDWRFYAQTGGQSSVYDLNVDGLTNSDDEAIVREHLESSLTLLAIWLLRQPRRRR